MRVSFGSAVVVAGPLAFASLATYADAQSVADQVIARENASGQGWQNKDTRCSGSRLAYDSTAFFSENPYPATDPKTNFLPRIGQCFERFVNGTQRSLDRLGRGHEQIASEDRDPRSRFISPWQPRRPSLSAFPQPATRRR
jgi:hypothetical protein